MDQGRGSKVDPPYILIVRMASIEDRVQVFVNIFFEFLEVFFFYAAKPVMNKLKIQDCGKIKSQRTEGTQDV